MEISGLETAIMEEAKGYETLIMCYHYCHCYCYSWLGMQGWKEEYKMLCNPVAVCDTITWILKGKKQRHKVSKEQEFWSHSHDDVQFHHSSTLQLHAAQYNLQQHNMLNRKMSFASSILNFYQVVLREEERASGQGESKSEKRLNQAKQVQWQNWCGVIPPCTLQLCTKHNVPLSWKFGPTAFTSRNTNKTHVHKPTIVDAAIHTYSHGSVPH